MKKLLLLGYGHSGVSFLRDFFSEIESNYVFPYEFWLTIFSGGIFDLGNTIEENSNSYDDSVIRRFLKLIDYLYNGSKNHKYSPLFNEKFLQISKDFASKLIINKTDCDIMWCNMHEQIKFPKLKFIPKIVRKQVANLCYTPIRKMNNDYGMYFLRTMTRDEYISLAKEYLEEIYSLFPPSEYLTLVHPLMVSSKYDNQIKYFDTNDKIIRITRDPRDVFVNLKRDIPDCTVAKTPYDFIEYFKKRRFNDHHNSKFLGTKMLDVKFEDFILNYEKTESEILEFCNISPEKHINRQTKANPKISIKNIGLYKDYKNQDEIKIIETELSQYCYYNLSRT